MQVLIVSALAFPIAPDTGYGGIERLAYQFSEELAREGHLVSLLAVNGTVPPPGVTLLDAGSPNPYFGQGEYESAARYLDHAKEFDVIHSISHGHWFARLGGIQLPVISVFWHDPWIAKFPEPNFNVVALSEWAAKRFGQVYFQDALVQETILINKEKYFYDVNIERGDWFLSLGKLSAEKGHLEAIEICKKANVPLKIIGGTFCCPADYVQAVKSNCNEDIQYLGEVTDNTKIGCLQRCKALIYPVGQDEVTSHKIQEALMCGTPIIAYNRGAMGHVIDEGVTGYLIEDRNQEAFANRMKDIERISNKTCRETAVKRWGEENVVRNYVKLYEQVAGGLRWY